MAHCVRNVARLGMCEGWYAMGSCHSFELNESSAHSDLFLRM